MTTADTFEAEYGDPVFQVTFQAFAEALDQNGILDAGDLNVTAGSNSNALDVAATSNGLWYNGGLHTYAGGTNVISLSSNSSGDDRWDLIYFDTSDDTPKKREGTPAAKPDLPSLQADEFPLAAVYVADGESNVTDSEIKNYRVHGPEAANVWVEDSGGNFDTTDLESVLGELLHEDGDTLKGALSLGTNPGAFGAVLDMVVDSNSTAGTEHSFLFAIDGTTLLKFYAESDGSGGLQKVEVDIAGTQLADGNTVLYEPGNEWFRNEVVQALRNFTSDEVFNAYPLQSGDIGGSQIGTSELDLSISPTWTGGHTFDVALVMNEVGTPSAAPSGYNRLYFKSDDLLYRIDDGGNEATVGALTVEDDQSSVTSPATAFSAGAGLSASDDGDGTATVDYEHAETFEGRESGSVSAGNQGVLIMDHLADGETVEVYKAVLVSADGTAVGSLTDLKLVTLDNAGSFTSQATLIAGDGSTVFDDETGSPLGSYTNSTGSGETIGVLVDNQESVSISIIAAAEGVTGA